MSLCRSFVAVLVIAFASSCSSGASSAIAQAVPPGVGTTLVGAPGPTPPPTPTPNASTSPHPAPKSTPMPTPTPTVTAVAGPEIDAGPGYSDVSPHQLVRTSKNVLYVAVPSCTKYPTCPNNAIAMQAGNVVGNPTSFAERDAADRPQSTGNDNIGSSALAIDANDVIWVVYNTELHGTHATSFDTTTGRWGRDATLGGGSAGSVLQGREGVALAIDRSNVPHAAYTFVGVDGAKHVALSTYASGAWTAPVQVDDAPLGGGGALHPTMAMTPANDMLIAWLVGNENVSYNNPDGTIRVRKLSGPSYVPGASSVAIPDPNTGGNPGYAATTIDQGPSMLVTAGGLVALTYIDTNDVIRFWYSTDGDARVWNGDRQPARQQTHDPALGPDGHGGLYIYGHGTPMTTKNGHGNDLYRMRMFAGSTTWSPFEQIVADNNVDCSVSTRWSQFFDANASQVDFTYWNDRLPNEQFVGTY